MTFWIADWLRAFAITLLVEVPIATPLLGNRRAQRRPPDRDRGRREPGDPPAGLVPVPGARALAGRRASRCRRRGPLLAEIAIYRLVWPSLSVRRAALVSLAANGASVAAGFALARFWR